MRLAFAPIASAFAILAGCAHVPKRPPVEMSVAGDGSGCRFEAEGRLLAAGNPAEAETMLAQAARRWKGRSVTILGGVEVPFKCFGLAIHVLQRELGHRRIGFISEPPPKPD